MIFKRWLLLCLIFSTLHHSSAAAQSGAASSPAPAKAASEATQSASARSELEQLRAKVQALEEELHHQKTAHEILANNLQNSIHATDARMFDYGNLSTMMANQTAWVGNLVATTAIGITLLVFAAGFATYFSTKAQAKKEARGVAKKWFSDKTTKLEIEIEKLLAKAEAAQESIASHAHKVLHEAEDASKMLAEAKAEAEAFMQQSNAKDPSGTLQHAPDVAASEFVQQANENLKSKPEKDFTADEHYIRGASLYHSGNLQAALDSFEAAIAHSSDATSGDQVKYRMAKAFTLDALHRDDEANAIYDELDHQFGQDPQDAVREQVAIGLFNKGISLGTLGRYEEAINIYDYLDYRYGEDTAPAVREQVTKGLFNKATKLGKLGRIEEEVAAYDDLDRRFGQDQTANVRSHMVKALNKLGKTRILSAKTQWTDPGARQTELTAALEALQRALNHCVPEDSAPIRADQLDRASVKGLMAYCLFLRGETDATRYPLSVSLRLGGADSLDALRTLAATHRLEPEDSQFDALLTEGWQALA